MRINLKIVLLHFFVCFVYVYNAKNDSISVMDTSIVAVKKPNSIQENEVLDKSDLTYKHASSDGRSMLDDFLEWLSEKLFGQSDGSKIHSLRNVVMWAVFIIAVIAAIWILRKTGFITLLKQRSKKTQFNFSELTEDLHSINFNECINKAEVEKDYRLATRWLFLNLLFIYDKQHLISFEPHKTNIDYSYEIKAPSKRTTFSKLCKVYDYVWYGEYNISINDYQSIKSEFLAQINSN
ncbi:MAG: hypothetical protein IM592_16585 [Bacteroidetes bacterium]|nr:hypothetical protein [Bacteroidota bacterium]